MRPNTLSCGLFNGLSSNIKLDKTLNCIGLHCPEPVFRTCIELDKMEPDEVLEIVADDPAAERDIKKIKIDLFDGSSIKEAADKFIKKATS